MRVTDTEPYVVDKNLGRKLVQADDDLPYVLKYAGEDSLVIGTDYGHQDQSSEIAALRMIREKGDVEPRLIDKILGENAIALYGL